MENCKNCNELIEGKYCANCGQPAKIKRIDGHYIIHEIEHILHFERGILYTVKELFLRPGENVREFIAENRSRLVKPIIFIIVTSLIYTLISKSLYVTSFVNFQDSEKSTAGTIFNWIQEHYGYANIMMGIFIALWCRIFFFKYEYNYFEILILLCFVLGIEMLIFSVFSLFTGLTHIEIMPLAGFSGIAYCTWAIGQFYNKSKAMSYVKAFAAYVLGLIVFFMTAELIGQLIDRVLR